MTPEGRITNAIMKDLRRKHGAFVFKKHGSAYGTAGTPDIIAVIDGRAVFLEVKQPGRSATRLQQVMIDRIRLAGGVAEVVHSRAEADEVVSQLESALCHQ